jgi:glycerol kinase
MTTPNSSIMSNTYILAIDQGTTSSRALVFDRDGRIKGLAQKEFRQIFPHTGWVEHDPEDIWNSQYRVMQEAIRQAGVGARDLAAIGITNQRETALAWDRKTGRPLCNAIVWQDRRTAERCEEISSGGLGVLIREKTGLVVDPYFSATKWEWMLKKVPEVREAALQGTLALGTVDTWLSWKLTGQKAHVTDVSNASRTMLFNIHDLDWDTELLNIFGISKDMLPKVVSSSEVLGHTAEGILSHPVPVSGIAGDQQSATFGQICLDPGMVKCTYGTGCFILCNTGQTPVFSENQLLTTIAWQVDGVTTYALEGSIFIGGAVVQWLRDGLGIISQSHEVESLAGTEQDSGGVYIVPAFTGLGTPHWDPHARGIIGGLTRGSTAGHIARASLESIAYQVYDVIGAMEADAGLHIHELRVDGGASVNDLLMQFQADLIGIPVVRPEIVETTALGAAFLAGLSTGYWSGVEEISERWAKATTFFSHIPVSKRESLIKGWNNAVSRSKAWNSG